MKKTLSGILPLLLLVLSFISLNAQEVSFDRFTENKVLKEGFYNLYVDEPQNKIFLEVDRWEVPFLYVNFLTSGVGSNDIGLDRGQLGDTRVVYFKKFGNKVLLIQPNLKYRAESDNEQEKQSVEEAFAQSVLAGFEIKAEKEGKYLIDLSDFLMQDVHGVAKRLKQSGQGSYSLAKEKSVLYLDNTKCFPKNTEMEVMLTFDGSPQGQYIRQVVPSPEMVTVRMRHSFVELPDDDYNPRAYHPFSGFYDISYMDYAAPITEDMTSRFIARHRLIKKNPDQAISDPMEPIVYYVDRGAPELVKQALIEGASWWNEAFEAAGFSNAFMVKELPAGADPLDVRYNVIQWVHRSTRGWSYGASVIDPRTGEIIKGHVSLGSLRVRQDFLIAQAFTSPYSDGVPEKEADQPLLDMALARIRQLSAHEVGHTIGLRHNFAASYNSRASVMDYPHPLIRLDENGEIDLSDAYDTGIGEWDKITIRFGYGVFEDEKNGPVEVLNAAKKDGYKYVSDADARAQNGIHPFGHLWDNGLNPAVELERLLDVRKKALANFSSNALKEGTSLSELEKTLAPLYYSHRYQTEAAVKIVGGMDFEYNVKGSNNETSQLIDPAIQRNAIATLMKTLDPANLDIPMELYQQLQPPAPGFGRNRESIPTQSGPAFDPLAAAKASASHTLSLLLNSARANRLVLYRGYSEDQPGLTSVFDALEKQVFNLSQNATSTQKLIAHEIMSITLTELFDLAEDENSHFAVRAQTRAFIAALKQHIELSVNRNELTQSVGMALLEQIDQYEKGEYEPQKTEVPDMPDGSPIGQEVRCGFAYRSHL